MPARGRRSEPTPLVPITLLPTATDGDEPFGLPSPTALSTHLHEVRSLVRACLEKGIDYGSIPGTGRKEILFASGAEKLLALHGLGHRLEQVSVDRTPDGNRLGVTYRAVITKVIDGAQYDVASCDAYAGRDESPLQKVPWNTVIKRAEKRALVSATKQATATAGLLDEDD